jgi:ribonuclease HI
LIVYTDGSCSSNVGGYGYLFLRPDGTSEQGCGRVPINPCTNQKAELFAIKKAVEKLKSIGETTAVIRTDSIYSIKALTEWISNWQRNGWRTANGSPVLNRELIEEIYTQLSDMTVTFEHVRGHTGEQFNEIVDELAKNGRLGSTIE